MIKITALLSFLLILASCTFVEPEILGMDNIALDNFEGRVAEFNVTARIKNDNGYAIKVKPSTLDVYVGDQYMGNIHLDKKIKLKKNQVTTIEAPFTATIADGALFKVMTLLSKPSIQIRLTGKVKASVFIITKKVDVDEKRTIDTSSLKLGS
ncbi:MAG: LEA type 2 family protein [Crocinitomicaceae bacterium]|nr:LEA type 2 family protein [Crocinitomicaceae bacterium]